MNETVAEIDEILEMLERTPLLIAALIKGLDSTRLHRRFAQEPWSANDVLAHLRACADVWGKSMLAMVTQDHPTMRYISPRTWIKRTDYPEQDFGISLEAFTKQRFELLEFLRALKMADWSRGATFTATTKGGEQTVFSYARRMALHESEHCNQLEALLREQ